MSTASTAALLLTATLLASAATAHAQPAEPETDATRRARARFVEGAALAGEGRWREALDRFEESAALKRHAVVTYNIAYCERALGLTTRAWYRFGRALAEDAEAGGAELTDDLERGAEDYAAELEQRLARAVVTVEPPDATLTVDGRPLQRVAGSGPRAVLAAGVRAPGPPEPAPRPTFELLLDPGRHSFVVRSRGATRTIEEEISAGPPRHLTLASIAPASPPPALLPSGPHPSQAAADTRIPIQRTGALVVGGLGLASLTAGAVFGAMAASRWSDARDACPERTTCPDNRALELSGEARRYGNVATIALVTAGTATAAAIVLWLTAPKSRSAARPVARRAAAAIEW